MQEALFVVVVVALWTTHFTWLSSAQGVEITNLSNWTHCSSQCWCAKDNHSRTYSRCSLRKLDKGVKFSLSRDLYSLSLANNGIRNIPPGIFSRLKNLEILSLANNSIEIIRQNAFQGLRNLRVLDLRFNNLKKWEDGPPTELPSLTTIKANGNRDWIPSQWLLNLPMLTEVYGVTWSQYCFDCDLIKTSGNETSIDDETGYGDGNSGDTFSGDDEDEPCHHTLQNIYLYHGQVDYGVSARFVEQGFFPQCFCDPYSECLNNDVDITFLRQLYNVPRKLFFSQYALGAFTILLNLFVLFVIMHSRILRKKTSFILVASMAMSDLLIGVYSVAIAKYNLFNEDDKVLPRVVMENVSSICSYIGMVFTTGQVTAVVNSLLLTLERYLVIVYFHGSRHRFKKRTLLVILSFTWMTAVVFASLPLVGVETLKYHKWFQCTLPFHTGKGILDTTNITLCISAMFVFLYLISLVLYVLIFCYTRKSSMQFGIKREAKLARKIAILVSTNFILFTLPTVLLILYVYNFAGFLHDSGKSFWRLRALLIVGGWLPVTCFSLNSLVNPFLYPFRHSRFQKELNSFRSRVRKGFSSTFHPVVVTAQLLTLRTSALNNHIRLHFHSTTARRDCETSVRVELQVEKKTVRRATV
ncbi:cannabinoid receptor 1-like [Montipora capricornis]|uniref:cannabinoid receptor 1-like n=1 Tax=Montipora capricornis TaxID=246305 RepID=UPI0035F1C7DF